MSWWRDGEKYGIFFNRDEQKTRPRAEPPFLWPAGFLAPKDPEGGGTWIAVNRSGLILALLNRWHEGSSGTHSRGLLIPELAELADTTDIARQLGASKLADYSPFTLIAMDASAIMRWDWTGSGLLNEPAIAPITSSSFCFHEVRAKRRQTYQTSVTTEPGTPALARYHEQSGGGAYAVRMLRDDAQTWSRSRITIESTEITWQYHEEFVDFAQPPRLWQSALTPSGIAF